MLETIPPVEAAARRDLHPLDAELLRSVGVEGVYARSGAYEAVVEALAALITSYRAPEAEVFRFPPVMNRRHLEQSGYLHSFPNLLGCVSCLHGGERDIRAAVDDFDAGGDWTTSLAAADLVLSPAACYPIYPMVAARGAVPAAGLLFDVASDCFRHEPSQDIDRLQSFRMREYVRIGAPQQIQDFREQWIVRAKGIADRLGFTYEVDVASDPFFGRHGEIMAVSQVQQALKFELMIPVKPDKAPTACMSFNYHQDHFGENWGIRDEAGAPVHTGCVAFGMDRLAVALFATHGPQIANWPEFVRATLKF